MTPPEKKALIGLVATAAQALQAAYELLAEEEKPKGCQHSETGDISSFADRSNRIRRTVCRQCEEVFVEKVDAKGNPV